MRRLKNSESLWRFLEIFALCGLLIAQPAFDLIAGSTRWIIAIQADWISVFTFTLIALILPPLAVWGAESLAFSILHRGRFERVRELLHSAILAGLIGLLVNSWLKPSGMPVRYRLLVSGFIAIAAFLARLRLTSARTFFRALAFTPLFYAVLFLLNPGTTALADAGAGHATPQQVKQAPKRIVVLAFDELPLSSLLDGQGQIDKVLFPAFSELANSSTWYRNSTTNADHTLRAFPALLSGKAPEEQQIHAPSARNFPLNLFSLLGASYKMNVHEAHEALCPVSVCTARNPYPSKHGLGALVALGALAAESNMTPISDNPPEIRAIVAPPSLDRATKFIQSIKPSNRRVLDYAHLMLPHQPWTYAGPSGVNTGFDVTEFSLWKSSVKAELGKQQHLLALQSADTILGDTIDRLKKIKAYDDALLVVTADHGIAFISGESSRTASPINYPSIVWTPLFIKAPRQLIHQVTDQPTESIDLLPTVLDYAGLPQRAALPGHSVRLVSPQSNPATVIVATGDNGGPGSNVRLDRTAGFNAVLASKNWPGESSDALRLYRVGPYGALVGEPAGVRTSPRSRSIKPKVVKSFNPRAKFQPLLLITGRVQNPNSQAVAISVNGIIGGLAPVDRSTPKGPGRISISMNPAAFRKGSNALQAYSVTGAVGAEVLTAIPFPQ